MTEQKPPPFDEQAALAQLERLRAEREAAQQIHNQKWEAFDRLIRSIPAPQDASRPDHQEPSQTGAFAENSVTSHAPRSSSTRERSRGARAPRGRWIAGAVITAAVAAVVIVAFTVPRDRPRTPAVPETSSPATSPVAPAVPQAQTPMGTPTPITRPPEAASLVLHAAAPVWMRVTVDGDKKIERVVAAGERLSFTGKAVVVRVGNGGDVFVVTNGREDPFGVAGQPVTRTFTLPSSPGRPDRSG